MPKSNLPPQAKVPDHAMSKMKALADPGKGLPPQAAEQARLNAWKRPRLKKDREALREERLIGAKEERANVYHYSIPK